MSNRKNTHLIKEREVYLWVNIILVSMVSLLLFYYVMMANAIAANSYKVQTMREELGALSEINGSLMSKKIALENPISLLEFARSNNLVEAKNVVYIFENRNVAQR